MNVMFKNHLCGVAKALTSLNDVLNLIKMIIDAYENQHTVKISFNVVSGS